MSSTDWAPADTTPAQLYFERTALDGLFIGAVAFGVHATLFFLCARLLYARRHHQRERYFMAYIVIVFCLSNIGNATNLKFGEQTFIDDRGYPGGPSAYFVQQSTNIMAVLCNCTYIVNSWFQDGLLLYRYWIILGKNTWTVVFPAIMFFGSFVLSCFLMAMLSEPNVTLWSNISFQIAISYWSISIAFNVIVTTLICMRLLLMRRRLRRAMRGESRQYLSISAMLVESAFLYSATGLFFLITFGVNSPLQNLALPALGQVQSIAPILIILRVAQGKAWSEDTATALVSSVRFKSRPQNSTGGNTSATMLSTFPSTKQSTLGGTGVYTLDQSIVKGPSVRASDDDISAVHFTEASQV